MNTYLLFCARDTASAMKQNEKSNEGYQQRKTISVLSPRALKFPEVWFAVSIEPCLGSEGRVKLKTQ